MKPRRIQLVLQGGGARIFALIAALEEIDEQREAGKIDVTRIAGTSAGAIAGGLYAAGVSPAEMRTAFASLDLEKLLEIPMPGGRWATARFWVQAAWRLSRGLPIASDEGFKAFLAKLLEGRGLSNPKLGELKIPLVIMAADVSNRDEIAYNTESTPQERLLDVMLDSSALPFFFRVTPTNSAKLVLDGGLIENLPVSKVTAGAGEDRIVVASFRESPSGRTPKGSLQLALALLHTAIDASVRRSKALPDILPLDLDTAGVDTFDFERAQRILSLEEGAPYWLARSETKRVLAEVVESTGRLVSRNRWENLDPTLSTQLREIYRQQHLQRPFRQHMRRLVLVANSLLGEGEEDFGTRDLVYQEMEFEPDGEPLYCIEARIHVLEGQRPSNVFFSLIEGDRETEAYVALLVADEREVPIPGTAERRRERVYAIQVHFTPPLVPSEDRGPYRLVTEFRLQTAFPDLLAGRSDEVVSEITRASGPVGRIEIEVQVPKTFKGLDVTPREENSSSTKVIHPARRVSGDNALPKRHFRYVRFEATEVPSGAVVAVDLLR
jgi:predicted acylesterase/phospholipase RssA